MLNCSPRQGGNSPQKTNQFMVVGQLKPHLQSLFHTVESLKGRFIFFNILEKLLDLEISIKLTYMVRFQIYELVYGLLSIKVVNLLRLKQLDQKLLRKLKFLSLLVELVKFLLHLCNRMKQFFR